MDPGCTAPSDSDETDPLAPAECSDGVDNDGDGFIDFPDDFGCFGAADASESGGCPEVDAIDITTEVFTMSGTPVPFSGSAPFVSQVDSNACGPASPSSTDVVYVLRLPTAGWRIRVDDLAPQRLHGILFNECGDAWSTVACAFDCTNCSPQVFRAEVRTLQLGSYFILLEMHGEDSYSIEVTVWPPGVCEDGLDNDGDGSADYPFDAGCEFPEDDDETDPVDLPACADGADNDLDGAIDFGLDPDCGSAAWDDETGGCGAGVPVQEVPWDVLSFPITDLCFEGYLAGTGTHEPVCYENYASGYERVYVIRPAFDATLDIWQALGCAATPPSPASWNVFVRNGDCLDPAAEVGCSMNFEPFSAGLVAGVPVYVFADLATDSFEAGINAAGGYGLHFSLQ